MHTIRPASRLRDLIPQFSFCLSVIVFVSLCFSVPVTRIEYVIAADEYTRHTIMMSTKRLDNFEVVCEWASCSFKGHTMEELSDHMSEHLKDYLGDRDALEELGEWRS